LSVRSVPRRGGGGEDGIVFAPVFANFSNRLPIKIKVSEVKISHCGKIRVYLTIQERC